MIADRAWVQRNLGFDPVSTPAPASTFAFTAAAHPSAPEDLQREIIDFDSEAPAGKEFLAFTTATGLSRFTDIPWPKDLAPKTGPPPRAKAGSPLPRADVLVVTWTVDEGHALSRVLTPGKDSHNDYVPYTHNFATISKKMRRGCPALLAKRLGAYWTTTIGNKSVVVFKSDSHMSQDGPELPNADVWRQIISEVQPKLVLTAGTAGGIGKEVEVGDVMVSPVVRFDCISKFKKEPFAQGHFSSSAPKTSHFAEVKTLFKANAGAASVGQQAAAENHQGRGQRALVLGGDHRFLRLRYVGRPFSSARPGRRVGDGRRRARDWLPNRWARRPRAGSPCATFPIRRSKPKAPSSSRPTWRRKSTKDSAAGVRSAAQLSAGR